MKRLLTIAATALLISTSSATFAQSVGEKTGVNSTLGISPTTADFVKEVAMLGKREYFSRVVGTALSNSRVSGD